MRMLIEFEYDDTIQLPQLLREAIRTQSSDCLLGLSLGIKAMRTVTEDQLEQLSSTGSPVTQERFEELLGYYKAQGVEPRCPLCAQPAEVVHMQEWTSGFGTIVVLQLECDTCPHHLSSALHLPYPL